MLLIILQKCIVHVMPCQWSDLNNAILEKWKSVRPKMFIFIFVL